jgi:enediyne biosynthesis protein E4
MALNLERRNRLVSVLVLAAVVTVLATGALALGGAGPTRIGDADSLGPPRYIEETASAGIDQLYEGGDFFVGGGVAVFDCSGDATPEVFIAGGSRNSALFRNDSLVAGALHFTRVSAPETDLTEVTGAYPIDIDGDALTDLAVLRRGESVLLRGLGNCRFERANETWGFDTADAWSAAFSATWEAGAIMPTLAVGNYLSMDADPTAGRISCADNELIRPVPGSDRYASATTLSPGWCALSMLFTDWDRSGRRDLRVSNDRHYYRDGEEQLWRMDAGQVPGLYTVDDGWVGMQIWGMGIASYDVTDDGYPEYYLTSQGDNKLQTLAAGPGQPRYADIALRRGVIATRPFAGDVTLPSTAWHPEFEDVNNDGLIDLFVAKGNVNLMPDFAQRDPSNLYLGQPDGTFREAADAAGILNFDRGRGAALADFNLDGLLDLIEVNYGAPVRLWRNVGSGDAGAPGPMGRWIEVQLIQPNPNHGGIGSWIEVRVGDRIQRREVTIGGGHAGGQLGWIHFGLGDAEVAEIRVQWPDGETDPWLSLDTNQFAVIERGAREPRIIEPKN